MKKGLRFLPLLILILFVGAVTWRLTHPANNQIASKMIGQNLSLVRAEPALPDRPGVWIGDPNGGSRVINFFGSWCVPCISEIPMLVELRKEGVSVQGIAVRDRPQDITAFLKARGDPYEAIGADPESEVQLQFGASGVPETFIVDADGYVRYQHIGPIEQKDLKTIRAKWEELRK
jgi:cytochrome c biogenesis protein CcmG/thiol:disulfide interchange protein DsbE